MSKALISVLHPLRETGAALVIIAIAFASAQIASPELQSSASFASLPELGSHSAALSSARAY